MIVTTTVIACDDCSKQIIDVIEDELWQDKYLGMPTGWNLVYDDGNDNSVLLCPECMNRYAADIYERFGVLTWKEGVKP